MSNSHVEQYTHFVWGTWSREPLITAEIEKVIYDAIRAKCHELKCQVRAIGGTEDHIHVLVRMPATIDVMRLAHGMKGASSHLIRQTVAPQANFRWQGAYAMFSVCPNVVPCVCDYIEHQKEHHAHNRIRPEWEQPAA
jgi:putative transposase